MYNDCMKDALPGTGAIRSEPDYRDAIARNAFISSAIAQMESATSLPDAFKTRLDELKVLMQEKIPACVSHAWALVMMWYWYKKIGKIIDFSPRFLDILSDEDWIPLDGGRVPRTVCRVSKNIGCCTTSLLPNDTSLSLASYRDKSVITQQMRDEAEKYKIPGYIRIEDNTVLDFRRGVKLFGLVSGLFGISDAFWTPSWAAADIDPLKPKTPTSNHQMVVFGWESALNWIQNSWSKHWNRNGQGTYDASKWLANVYEGWAIADIPDDLKELLSNLPKPSDFSYAWKKDMTRGEYSDDVKFAQIALMVLGILKDVAPSDLGHYGPKTSTAVLQYQAILKIPPADRNPDRIGPKTRAGLNAQFSQ